MHSALILLLLRLVAAALGAEGQSIPPDQTMRSCGYWSIVALSQLVGSGVPDDEEGSLAVALPPEGASMLDLQSAARTIGLDLTGVTGPLGDLAAVPGPKIVHLQAPSHFVVWVRADDQWAQVMDGGRLAVVPREELEERYSGHALIVDLPESDGGPRAEVGSFVQSFGIAGVGQRIEHPFHVTNTGDQPLTLEARRDGG